MIPRKPALKIGRSYFLCGYYLRDLPVPEIETWIYVGTNIYNEDKTEPEPYHYFEHPSVYFSEEVSAENSKYHNQEQEAPDVYSEDPLQMKLRVAESKLEALVYDYAGMQEWVMALGDEKNADKVF